MKTKFTWRLWRKEAAKTIPLILAVLLALTQGLVDGAVATIFMFYIAHLYDLKWQERIKFNS